MSGRREVTYRVEDWLAALEREQARLTRIYVAMDAGIALAGIAMIVLALSWPVHEGVRTTFNVCWGAFFVITAIFLSPMVSGCLSRKLNARALALVENSGLNARLLAGEVNGTELHTALPRMWRWLARPLRNPDPQRVLRHVGFWAYHYTGSREASLLPIAFTILALFYCAVGFGSAYSTINGIDWPTPELRSMQLLQGLNYALSSGIALPLLLLLNPRVHALFVVYPVLKRQWEAELECTTER